MKTRLSVLLAVLMAISPTASSQPAFQNRLLDEQADTNYELQKLNKRLDERQAAEKKALR